MCCCCCCCCCLLWTMVTLSLYRPAGSESLSRWWRSIAGRCYREAINDVGIRIAMWEYLEVWVSQSNFFYVNSQNEQGERKELGH